MSLRADSEDDLNLLAGRRWVGDFVRNVAACDQFTSLGIIQFRDGLTGGCREVDDKRHLHLSRGSVHQERLELILHCDLLDEGSKLSIVV
jgi:hypothetical protein